MFDLTIDPHIRLRTLHPDHAEELFSLMERNRARLQPWIHPSALPETREGVRRFVIECFFNSIDDPMETMFVYADYFKELNGYFRGETPPNELGIWKGEKLAGAITMSRLKDSSTAIEFGYWITEEHEGKGITARCVSALMTYAIENMDVQRFVIGCAVKNHRSRAIPERLGYRLHVIQPNQEIVGNFVYDRAIYGIRASAWRERNSRIEHGSGNQ